MENNIRAIRKRRGLTQEQVAELTGGTKGQISKLENGGLQLGMNWMEKLARALDVEPFELIASKNPIVRVPLIGWVSAGQLAMTREVDINDLADCPQIECHGVDERRCIALEVKGDSMNLVAPESSTIIVDVSQKEMNDGKFYVVATNGGEATFKRFRASPNRLEPVSTNPVHEIIFPQTELRVIGRVIRVMQDL
ncbi:LexA family protein [Thalassospira mesophila]|uniref:LexA family protein n=1 Tax=Thalassospira mesophila TaxID=1293891 RepID=UPI0013023A04|nr:S24 family peptidase [Thalassospira mesophila]